MSNRPPDSMAVRHELARNLDGKFATSLEVAERDAYIASLRKRGMSVLQISRETGIPRPTVYSMLERAYAAVRAEPAAEARAMELQRLDDMLNDLDHDEQVVREMMARQHVTVSQGRVVYDDSGEAVPDESFGLQCLDRIERIRKTRLDVQARRARLAGLDAPAQTEVAGSVTYQIIGLDTPETAP